LALLLLPVVVLVLVGALEVASALGYRTDGSAATTFATSSGPKISKLSPASGKRGSRVTITGKNFAVKRGRGYVKFGRAKCSSYKSWSAGKIVCLVPKAAAAAKCTVKVTTAKGTSSGKSYTVVVPSPTPTPTPTPDNSPWVAVSAGVGATFALKGDGTLWAWGSNEAGELGLGDSYDGDSYDTPTQVGSASDWTAVCAGASDATFAIKSDGTLWAWGANDDGQLGLGDSDWSDTYDTPTQVGSASDWTAVCAGYGDAFALRSDGTLWSWGWNEDGQLGLGDTTSSDAYDTPTQVGSDSDWTALLGTGYYATFAIRSDGTVWAWSFNGSWQLGLGDFNYGDCFYVPTQVGSDTDWTDVSASYGASDTFATKSGGTLWAWGSNDGGELGLGVPYDPLTAYDSPTNVGSDSDWTAVSAGRDGDNFATKSDGTLWAWGSNDGGELGLSDSNYADTYDTPTQVGSDGDWVAVCGDGDDATFAVKSDGTLWAWGYNGNGQLGLGDSDFSDTYDTPTQVGGP
jgi:alpha-tubulin suppressor-like RCC1 family protein